MTAIKLYNHDVTDQWGSGRLDWAYDEKGNVRTISGRELLEQHFLKIIFTKTTTWGYGSYLANVIGRKIGEGDGNITKAGVFQEVTRALLFLRRLQLQNRIVQPDMKPLEILGSLVGLRVEVLEKTQINVDVTILADDDTTIESSINVSEASGQLSGSVQGGILGG